MSAFMCVECDQLKDGDYIESYEWGDDTICIDCHTEATPEDFDDWTVTYWAKPIPDRRWDWEIVHKNYDGPGDPRAFTGPSVADVWQQAIDYNEENKDE